MMFEEYDAKPHLTSEQEIRTVLSVTQFSQYLKKELEHSFSQVWLSGELSGVFKAQSGHIYCHIKDQQSQFKLVIFKGVASKLAFEIQEGQQVIVCAQITVYKPRGELQLTAKTLEPEGLGALKLAYDQLKQRLRTEGLFEMERKKLLPKQAERIGLITSKDGAVLHDMINVIRRRDPTVQIIHYVTPVQGPQALNHLINALEQAQNEALCEVYILARGGGSLEDLWNFNEERLVRRISDFCFPIISAVGHETDVTLSDFVADKRAPTPSIAAELVTIDRNQSLEYLKNHSQQLTQILRQIIIENEQFLDRSTLKLEKAFDQALHEIHQIFQRFFDQGRLLKHRIDSLEKQIFLLRKSLRSDKLKKQFLFKKDQLISLSKNLKDSLREIQQKNRQKLEAQISLLKLKTPKPQISYLEQKLDYLHTQLKGAQKKSFYNLDLTIEKLTQKLKNSSVHQQLKKGLALLLNEDFQRISSVQEVSVGENYQLTLHDGNLKVQVKEIVKK